MRRRRFHCSELKVGDVTLCADESHHALHVLRCRTGELVVLFDGQGAAAQGEISDIGGKRVTVRIERITRRLQPVSKRLTLITALPRRPRQPILFEKCCELGTSRIIATNFARSAVKATPKAVERWQRTAIEAAKQCESLYIPEITTANSLEASIDRISPNAKRLFGDPLASEPLAEVLNDVTAENEVVIWIGPEGGFTESEKSNLIDAGVVAMRLSSNVLRIETACIAVAAIVSQAAAKPQSSAE